MNKIILDINLAPNIDLILSVNFRSKSNNCNIIRSYDQLRDGSNLIKKISYLAKVDLSLVIRHLNYPNFLINFLNQSIQSIFSINLQLNQ